jgi:hypothetical protein
MGTNIIRDHPQCHMEKLVVVTSFSSLTNCQVSGRDRGFPSATQPQPISVGRANRSFPRASLGALCALLFKTKDRRKFRWNRRAQRAPRRSPTLNPRGRQEQVLVGSVTFPIHVISEIRGFSSD